VVKYAETFIRVLGLCSFNTFAPEGGKENISAQFWNCGERVPEHHRGWSRFSGCLDCLSL